MQELKTCRVKLAYAVTHNEEVASAGKALRSSHRPRVQPSRSARMVCSRTRSAAATLLLARIDYQRAIQIKAVKP
jgi:hypothetical protein